MKIDNERPPYTITSKQKSNKNPTLQAHNHKSSMQKLSRREDNQHYDKIHQYDARGNWGNLQQEENKQIKNQNAKLKRMLKQTQAKRIQITKQCSQLASKYEKLQEQNMHLHRKLKDVKEVEQCEKFRYEELKFLNKQLSAQIQQLQKQNQMISDKLKHQSEILQKKYEQLQQKTYKRIEQALKRIKKAIHYLSSLSAKQIEKTKSIQLQNLTKAAQILKGKYSQNTKYQEQIQQLMNPIRNIQQDLHKSNKELLLLKEQNGRLTNELKKQKKIQKQLLPQYKQAVQKLKKNLAQVRLQLTQNQYDKCQVKRKYEEKIKQIQIKYEQLFKQNRKIKLENKIYEKKLQQIEDDVQQQKQRLMGENQLLKKLYKSQELQMQEIDIQKNTDLYGQGEDYQQQSYYLRQNQTDGLSNKTTANHMRKDYYEKNKNQDAQIERRLKDLKEGKISNNLKKNYSQSHLKVSQQKQYNKETLQTKKDRQGQKSLRRKQKLILNQDTKKNKLDQKYRKDPMSMSRQSESKRKNYEHLRHNKIMTHSQNQQKLELSEYEHQGQTPKYKGKRQIQNENEEEINFQDQYEYGLRQQISNNSISSASQQGLKNQIFKIDQEIMEIQKTLDKELNMYK